jgi:hypothetical protein
MGEGKNNKKEAGLGAVKMMSVVSAHNSRSAKQVRVVDTVYMHPDSNGDLRAYQLPCLRINRDQPRQLPYITVAQRCEMTTPHRKGWRGAGVVASRYVACSVLRQRALAGLRHRLPQPRFRDTSLTLPQIHNNVHPPQVTRTCLFFWAHFRERSVRLFESASVYGPLLHPDLQSSLLSQMTRPSGGASVARRTRTDRT